jgi:hypothetical protein
VINLFLHDICMEICLRPLQHRQTIASTRLTCPLAFILFLDLSFQIFKRLRPLSTNSCWKWTRIQNAQSFETLWIWHCCTCRSTTGCSRYPIYTSNKVHSHWSAVYMCMIDIIISNVMVCGQGLFRIRCSFLSNYEKISLNIFDTSKKKILIEI